jgi:hypothetical protein
MLPQKLPMLKDRPQSEKEIKTEIKKYLKGRGIFCWNEWQGQFSVKGVPDLIGILPGGRLLGVEVKRAKGTLRPEQEEFITKINRCGGLAFVARSVTEVHERLEGLTSMKRGIDWEG